MDQLRIFYDGACHLCYREVKAYKKKDYSNLLLLVDISSNEFDANNYGLDNHLVNIHMHSMSEDGKIYKGIDTFIEIWKRVPPYNKLIPIFENSALRPLFDSGYNIFAKFIRPNLPKRDCENGQCQI